MLATPSGMAATPQRGQRLTYADLAGLPGDRTRWELYDGAVHSVPTPPPGHDAAAHAVLAALQRYAQRHGGRVLGAPFDLVLAPHDVIQPDVAFYHASRCALIHDGPPFRHPPDLVAEILSPSTAAVDRGPKLQMLARYGILEYWIVDPAASTIDVQVLRDGRYEFFTEATGDDPVWSTILIDLKLTPDDVFR